jgi:hypothetical protein
LEVVAVELTLNIQLRMITSYLIYEVLLIIGNSLLTMPSQTRKSPPTE